MHLIKGVSVRTRGGSENLQLSISTCINQVLKVKEKKNWSGNIDQQKVLGGD